MVVEHYILPSQTRITQVNMQMSDDYINACIKEVKRLGDKQNHITNVKASMSSWFIWNETKIFDQLLTLIHLVIEKEIPLDKNEFDTQIYEAWVNYYKQGEHTEPHIHTPSIYSFCYYLKADENSSPLVFPHINYEVLPAKNLLVIFPSYLTHFVPNNNSSERIVLSGNVKIEPKVIKLPPPFQPLTLNK